MIMIALIPFITAFVKLQYKQKEQLKKFHKLIQTWKPIGQ